MYHVQHVILGMPGHWSKRCVTPYRNSETLNLGRAFVKALYHTKAKLQIDELKAVLRQCLSPAACRLSLISSVSVTANALARLTPAAGPTITPPKKKIHVTWAPYIPIHGLLTYLYTCSTATDQSALTEREESERPVLDRYVNVDHITSLDVQRCTTSLHSSCTSLLLFWF